MAKHHRNRKRHPQNTSPARIATPGERLLANLPPPAFVDQALKLSLCPEVEPPTMSGGPAPEIGGIGSGGSRANALRHSRRSKILFSMEIFEQIEELYQAFAIQFQPVGLLEEYLVYELARSKTIDEQVFEQLIFNKIREINRIELCWSLDAEARVEKLASRLGQSPELTAGALSRTKHGCLYMIKQWSLLEEAIQTNGGLDEAQRSACFNLLGINPEFRNGSRRVPAGDDTKGLTALVAREIARHRGNLERTLNHCDEAEKQMATLGIANQRDSATRLLLADQRRVRRRFDWALDILNQLRGGADPATLIDPDTGQPVTPGPRPRAVTRPAAPSPAAAPAPAPVPAPAEVPAPTATPASPPAAPIPPLSEGLSVEDRETLLLAAGALLGQTATTPAATAGPPPTA